MRTSIRIFNDQGIGEFRNYLNSVQTGKSVHALSDSFLTDEQFSFIAEGEVEVERLIFAKKEEIVKYLFDKISTVKGKNKLYDQGMWTWLSAFYFDSVCPIRNGVRKPGVEARHILASKEWKRYYRHLLAAPVRLYSEMADRGAIYLVGPPDQHGDLFEQLASRIEYATSPGIVEAATLLYWDSVNNKIKKGARNKDTHPGVLRRFTGAILPQYMLTYDVNGMSGQEILELLPEEFSKWKS
jgi:hypothetical protein